MPGRVFGVSRIILNGVDYGTMPGATIALGGEQLESQYASGKRVGSSGTPVPSRFQGKIVIQSDTDVEAIRKFKGQVDYVTDVGITYSAKNAETMEPPTLNDQGGGLDVTIEGDPAEKA